MNAALILLFLLVLPFAGGVLGYVLRNKAAFLTIAATGLAWVLSVVLYEVVPIHYRFEWLPSVSLGWRLDAMAVLLIALVLFISLLVQVFSFAYIKKDEHPRYFLKLGFFTFSMVGLLSADHLLLLFVFWELVGFASYLLIGFWYQRSSAATGAKWAFLTNRLADFALLAGVLAVGTNHTFFLSDLNHDIPVLAGFGLLIGAMGKSAQFPFSAWLPRAMEGPTPVSALIHAATMVAAGVYLLIRVSGFLPEVVLLAAAIIGVVTAVYGAMTALTQHDLKAVLAYSTISQLGFMFLGIGVEATESSFFHLWTHAFFKAGLFLVAGYVIHQTGTQDMRRMGGLFKEMKWGFAAHFVCAMALAGIPFFSGFMSKEGILAQVGVWSGQYRTEGFDEAHIVLLFAYFAVFMTALYIARQLILVYFHQKRSNMSLHEKSNYMLVPVIILAVLSLGITQGTNLLSAHGWVIDWAGLAAHHPEDILGMIAAMVLAVSGLLLAYLLFVKSDHVHTAYKNAGQPGTVIGKVSYFGLYLDKFYGRVAGYGYAYLTKALAYFDHRVIDGFINSQKVFWVVVSKVTKLMDNYLIDGLVSGVVRVANMCGRMISGIQAGKVQSEIQWLIFGLILILMTILLV